MGSRLEEEREKSVFAFSGVAPLLPLTLPLAGWSGGEEREERFAC
jgi:hypothetical protein